MSLIAKDSGGGDWDPVPAATHFAVCTLVVDIGLQDSGKWGKKEKVYIGFQIPSVRVEWDDKEGVHHEGPAMIGSRYTNSLSDKAILGQHLTSWRGRTFTEEERRGFDLSKLLGVGCMLSVVHKTDGSKTYANISAIMRLPQGTPVPAHEGELLAYSPQTAELIGNLTKLPEWLQKLCHEGHGAAADSMGSTPGAPPPSDDEFGDSIPF